MRVAILNHLNKTDEARSELNRLIAELVNFPELSENEVCYVQYMYYVHAQFVVSWIPKSVGKC